LPAAFVREVGRDRVLLIELWLRDAIRMGERGARDDRGDDPPPFCRRRIKT
jgi:hypothetical protein